jgi:hypothetical protein
MRSKKRIKGHLLVDGSRVDDYKPAMPRDPNELAKYREAIAALELAEPVDRLDVDDIDKASGALLRMCRRRASHTGALTKEVSGNESNISYRGLSISEAAAKYLKLAGKAQRAAAIIEAVVAGGFETTSEKPISALKVALERRARNYDDVVLVAYGTWTHRDNLTDKDKAALEHKARTSRGMAAARQRGVLIGPAPKITPEIEAEMEKLIEDGWGIRDIAKRYKVSEGAVRLRFRSERVKAIRKRVESKDRPNLRVVAAEGKA